MKLLSKQSGTSLLLAVLIMAGILSVSLATSRLVINEVAQSYQLDKAMVAFYAAEAGIERSLYEVRKRTFSASQVNGSFLTLDNLAAYELVAKDTEDYITADITENDSYQLDLFKQGSLSALANPIKSLRLEWQGVGSWLDIGWSSWTTSGAIQDHDSIYISQASSPYFVKLFDANNYLYRIRLLARNANIDNLDITAYSNLDPAANCQPLSACQVPIPGRIFIKSIGEYPENSERAARQAILVTMPQKSPVSGLFDYVLYSEEEIIKEN